MKTKSCRNCLACGGAPTDCWVLCVHASVIEEHRTPNSDGKSTLVGYDRAEMCRHYIPTRNMPIGEAGQRKTYRPDRIKAAKPQFLSGLSRYFPEDPNPEVTPGTIVYPPADTVELNAKRSLALRIWPTDKLIETIRLMQTGYTMIELHMELTRRMKKGTV